MKAQLSSWFLLLYIIALSDCQINLIESGPDIFEPSSILECRRKLYTYRVTQRDENGRACWDTLKVWACLGRCDSIETSDYRFPYKKSRHPVCVHYGRIKARAELRFCEEGALETASKYEYIEAEGCRCQQCSSSDTSCEGPRYRPSRSQPDDLGFE